MFFGSERWPKAPQEFGSLTWKKHGKTDIFFTFQYCIFFCFFALTKNDNGANTCFSSKMTFLLLLGL